MKTVTLTLTIDQARALIDMADYGADEKMYWLDQPNHGYNDAEWQEAERFVLAAQSAVMDASKQLAQVTE